MDRRIIRDNCALEAKREANSRTARRLNGGVVLNVLQWHQRGVARFTIEGEGADVWFCDQAVFEQQTQSTANAAAGPLIVHAASK